MKRIVAVGIIAVFACALFLVPYASAKVKITCSVYPEEADFQSEFVYSITLTNPSSNIGIGELGLRVGSDSDNMDITREWDVAEMELEHGSSSEIYDGNKIKIPAHGSCTVKKRVQFIHPKLKQGDFRDWTETTDPKWKGAWYDCCFKPWPYGDEACCEVFGEPILTHCEEKFKEHHVVQNEAYKDLSFDYSITVCANCEDRIELKVRNYNTSSSGWDKYVLQNYTERDVYTNKTLTWHAVNLTLDNFDSEGRGHYKFVGDINKSQPYSGPTIEERFDDPRVSYKKTINELLSFDYEVTVWIDQVKDSIKLEVYNYNLRDWEQKGIRNYTTPGIKQKLRWESINLSSDHFEKNTLSGKYRFVGSYNKSENINPRIKEKFDDLRVTPTQGKNNRTFNYSVTVNANICDKIELQVKNHTTTNWDSKGTRDYVTSNIKEPLTWHNIQLNTHELNRHNDSMFRFEGNCGAKSSEKGLPIWPINPFFRNPSVKPDRGLYSDNFYYSVDVKAEKNGTVNLSIFCPAGSFLYEPTLDYNKAPEWQTLTAWPLVQNFNGCDEKTGAARYRFGFWYKGNEIINLTGEKPYIDIAKFGNGTVKPEIWTDGTLFNYTINVTAAHEGDVLLLTKCPGGTQWDTRGEREYATPKKWKTLKWTRIELPCDNCGNAEYKFRFIQGDVPSENYTGPMITIDEFGKLLVSPGNGSKHTEFNFSVNFSSCIEEDLTLQVWNSNSEIWKNVSTEHYIPPDIETITFSKIRCPENLVPQWSDERVIKWRVTSSISNCNTTSTYWDIGLKWYNSSFYPEKGEWNKPVTFSVNLSANLNGSIELQIKLDDSKKDSWNPIGERGVYNKSYPQIVRWPGKSICNEPYEGNVSYRFVFYWRGLPYPPSHSYPGPKLFIPINISILSNVSPNDGICYVENHVLREHFRNSDIPLFTYSINVSAAKDTSIKLVTINPLGEATEYEARRYYAPGIKTLNWTIESTNFEPMGIWNYKFMYRYDARYGWVDYREEKYKGPKIIAVLRDFDIDPELLRCGDSCNVTVVINGSRDIAITLELCNLTSPCKHVQNGEKSYNSSEGEQPMVWKDIKPWELFRCKDTLLFNLNVTWMKEDV